jgi:septum formation protein
MLLASAGLVPEIVAADVDETPRAGEPPIAYALRVATDKARAVADARAILAADTVVALDGLCLGKPADRADARALLARLAGRTHVVHTAVVVAVGPAADKRLLLDVVSTEVRFRALAEHELDRYVATGEGDDKAGAYGIQGEGGALVAHLSGSYTNVVGLPLEQTLRLLALAGVR